MSRFIAIFEKPFRWGNRLAAPSRHHPMTYRHFTGPALPVARTKVAFSMHG